MPTSDVHCLMRDFLTRSIRNLSHGALPAARLSRGSELVHHSLVKTFPPCRQLLFAEATVRQRTSRRSFHRIPGCKSWSFLTEWYSAMRFFWLLRTVLLCRFLGLRELLGLMPLVGDPAACIMKTSVLGALYPRRNSITPPCDKRTNTLLSQSLQFGEPSYRRCPLGGCTPTHTLCMSPS